MAINIYREPDAMSTPYSSVYFDVSSDESTIVSMIADIYVNTDLVATLTKEPVLDDSSSFRFDIGDVLKKHFTRDLDLDITATNYRDSGGSASNYYIRAFEVLDNGTTFDTSWSEDGTGTNYEQSTTLNAFDGLLHYEQVMDDYICESTTDYILTNRPYNNGVDKDYKTSCLRRGIPFEFGFLVNAKSVEVRVQEFDLDYNSLTDTTYGTFLPTNDKGFISHNGTYDNDTKYIKFRVRDSGTNPISYSYIFKVLAGCESDNVIFWKNQYGSYDYYSFGGNYKKKATSRSKQYSRRLDFEHNIGDRGETVRTKTNKEDFTLYTKTENSRVIDWLHEILQSTDVYFYDFSVSDTSKRFIPIIITGGKSSSLDDNNPVTQFSLKYRLANPKQSQIG